MPPETLPIVSGDKDRSLQEVLRRLAASPRPHQDDGDPIVTAAHRMPAVPASFAPFPDDMDDRLRAALETRGIEQLYTHQSDALEHVLAGRNVVTTTPTASGKTLCYNAPVLNAILKDPSTRALYLFPTKALAQDQLAELHALVETIESAYPSEAPGSPTRQPRWGGPPEGSAEGAAERERVGVPAFAKASARSRRSSDGIEPSGGGGPHAR
jgi:hypothetical protein